jgi:C1A family cysteine protease
VAARGSGPAPRRFATGCRKDPYDARDYQVRHFLTAAPRQARVDWRAEMPPVFNQGQVGTCVACATAYYDKSFQEGREHSWSMRPAAHRFSPLFIYSQRADKTGDNGMNIREAMKIVRAEGACPLSLMPYEESAIDTPPTAAQRRAAEPYRARSFARLMHITEMERYLQDNCFVAGLMVHESFMTARRGRIPMPVAGDPFVGGHALCIAGFDSSKQEFYFANSWGPDWGDAGYGVIDYDVFTALLMDAWGMVDMPGDRA